MNTYDRIAANPFLTVNYRVFATLGYLNIHDRRALLSVVPGAIMLALQLSYLVFAAEDMIWVAFFGYYFGLHFNCWFRVVYTMKIAKIFEAFLVKICRLYDGIMGSNHPESIRILEEMTYWNTIFTKLNICLGTFAVLTNSIYPYVFKTRNHPFPIYLRVVDFLSSPLFEVAYAVELVISTIACCMYIPFCNFFFSFVLFGIALIRILKERFRNIAEPFDVEVDEKPDDALITRRFRVCIEMHKMLIKYGNELNPLLSTVFLVEMLIFGGMLCFLLFLIQVVTETTHLVMGVMQIMLILFQLFVLYFMANQLIEESNDLGPALYDSPWYCFSTSNQRILILVLAQTQKPVLIMVGNIAPITLQTFQSLLNASYSYFNIMRNSLNEK